MAPMIDVEAGEPTEFELLPTAAYKVTVVKCDLAQSKTGNPKISWMLKVIEHAEYTNRQLPTSTSLQPQATWKLEEFLKALHITYSIDVVGEKRHIRFNTDDAMHKVALAAVSQATVDGVLRNQVDRLMPVP